MQGMKASISADPVTWIDRPVFTIVTSAKNGRWEGEKKNAFKKLPCMKSNTLFLLLLPSPSSCFRRPLHYQAKSHFLEKSLFVAFFATAFLPLGNALKNATVCLMDESKPYFLGDRNPILTRIFHTHKNGWTRTFIYGIDLCHLIQTTFSKLTSWQDLKPKVDFALFLLLALVNDKERSSLYSFHLVIATLL